MNYPPPLRGFYSFCFSKIYRINRKIYISNYIVIYRVYRKINISTVDICYAFDMCVALDIFLLHKNSIYSALRNENGTFHQKLLIRMIPPCARREGDHRRWWKVQFSFRNAEYIACRYVCFTTNSIYYYVIRYINLAIYSIYFAEAK